MGVTLHSAAATVTSSQAGVDTRQSEEGTTAMPMLAEQYDYVIGGDPDRDTIDLAVLDATSAGVRAHLAQTADGAGYVRMLSWARQHAPGARVWALEGTGNYGAGIASFLAEAGEDVVEIDRVKRVRRGGKNDQIDAVRAAREALSREIQVNPASVGCGRRCGSCSPLDTRCWSAARKRSTNSKR